MRLLGERGSAERREVVSGSATQGLWLRNRKVGTQVSGIDRSRLPGRRTVREVRRGRGRRASDKAKKRAYRFRVRLGRKRRASRLPCLSLGNDRRGASRSGDVSLTIFIASVSGSESLASFADRFFHLSRPPGFRMASFLEVEGRKPLVGAKDRRERGTGRRIGR